jgi:ABC-2 type transport system permease protein
MIAIFKREIMNYLKRPLFWVGVLLVIYGVFNATSPYLTTHYLTTGEKIINDQSNTSVEGEVYEGYIPATPEKHREVWHEKVKIKLTDVFGLTDSEAQNVIEKLESMNLKEAYAYLEQEYDWYGARYLYEDSTYYKGTAEEINAYLDKKLEDKTFSFYYARKFADFAGLYMVFFAIIMLAVLFLQDTKKHTYELLHTKPVTAGKYVMGKVSAGFTICLLVLTILNILFWVLCRIYTKDSGFEVRLWDFVASTVLYILPNMLMIVSIYTLISLIFKNPLPGVPLLILYMVYSNLGGTNAEGVYGYWGKPLAIMVRRVYTHTFCADEIFVQTICWNSSFRDRVYDMHDEGHGCLRMIGWKDNQLEEWKEKDFEILMNSEALFARKFSIRHIEVVDQILNEISK